MAHSNEKPVPEVPYQHQEYPKVVGYEDHGAPITVDGPEQEEARKPKSKIRVLKGD